MNKRSNIRPCFIFIVIPVISALWAFAGQGCSEQNNFSQSTQQPPPVEVSPGQVEKRIEEIRDILTTADNDDNAQTALQHGVTVAAFGERKAILRDLENTYQRLLTGANRRDSLNKEEENLREKLNSAQESLLPEHPSYSLSFYDSYLDQLTASRQGEQAASNKLEYVKKEIERATEGHDKAAQKLRSTREQLEPKVSAEENKLLTLNHEYAKLEEEISRASLNLQRLSYENALTEEHIAQMKTAISGEQVSWVKSHLAYEQEDLGKHLKGLEDRRQEVQKHIKELKEEQAGVENKWQEAQRNFEALHGADESVNVRATAFLKSREAWRETYQRVLEQAEIMMDTLNEEEKIWQRRYTLLRSDMDYSELNVWKNETGEFVRKIERAVRLINNYQSNLESKIASIENQLSDSNADPVLREHREAHLKALQKNVERNLELVSTYFGASELGQRLIDEIGIKKETASLMIKVKGLGDRIQKMWEFELWVVDEHSVTVKKIVVALFIFIAGFLLIRIVARIVRKRLISATSVDITAAAAIEKVVYYIALLFLFLFTLRTVHIPMTAFTFLGGAIAIGVGFGAQNLINNFISGFILMVERPVKIGDMIEVENSYGIIEEIGSRCTRILTASNIHILVPNSSFLEKNIINWTLSDQKVRAQITVGVVYGSDIHTVRKLLLKAVHEHEKVLQSPEPFVLFNDFGENALIFDVYFWVSMKHLFDRRMIQSDIRFRIDDLFREAGIIIAFPQRDIHLDTSKPIDLRILRAGEEDIKF